MIDMSFVTTKSARTTGYTIYYRGCEASPYSQPQWARDDKKKVNGIAAKDFPPILLLLLPTRVGFIPRIFLEPNLVISKWGSNLVFFKNGFYTSYFLVETELYIYKILIIMKYFFLFFCYFFYMSKRAQRGCWGQDYGLGSFQTTIQT